MSYSITFSNNKKVEKHSIVVTSNVYMALVLLNLGNVNGLVLTLKYIQASHVIIFSILKVVLLIFRLTKDAGH